jgi:large subunit ribosomal protein L13e
MVKHNNVIANIHCHKKYCASSRGPLHVKVNLNQAQRKKTRRQKRAAKAAKVAPRPLKHLRPIVNCPTQRYNSKVRLGRGFSLEELKAAGVVNGKYARTIGIAVDHRRYNRNEDKLQINVDRLKEYLSKLVIFPKKASKPYKGDSSPEDCALATQVTGTIMPLEKSKPAVEMVDVTDEMKGYDAYVTMKHARKETKVAGQRVALAIRKKNSKK